MVGQEVADEDEEGEEVVDSPQGPQHDLVVLGVDAVYVRTGAAHQLVSKLVLGFQCPRNRTGSSHDGRHIHSSSTPVQMNKSRNQR